MLELFSRRKISRGESIESALTGLLSCFGTKGSLLGWNAVRTDLWAVLSWKNAPHFAPNHDAPRFLSSVFKFTDEMQRVSSPFLYGANYFFNSFSKTNHLKIRLPICHVNGTQVQQLS